MVHKHKLPFSLNWNNEEMASMHTIYAGRGEKDTFFTMSRGSILNKNKIESLKHLARLAVLTSFSYNQLLESNLPSLLFDYLGIGK